MVRSASSRVSNHEATGQAAVTTHEAAMIRANRNKLLCLTEMQFVELGFLI
jgi:hypothetical protein